MQAPPAAPIDAPAADYRWFFGAFVLWEMQRRLERTDPAGAGADGAQAVRIGPRSFELLLHLVRRAGEYIAKEELLATVWSGVVVEEASVRVHMSMLRKALGEPGELDGCHEWISTVPQRGYRFNGRVRREAVEGDAAPAPVRLRAASRTFAAPPTLLTELIGRDADVDTVLGSLEGHRLVTLVGAGGIGKTSVATRASECLQQRQGVPVAFVDLAPLISQDHVLSTMARALGAAPDMPDTIQAITQTIVGRDVLLVIDNCEHVIETLAAPVLRLLGALPGLRILATSREALRVPGELVLRLAPLAVPAEDAPSLTEALRAPAVQLLVGRARAAGAGPFQDAQGPLLARVARQLDGIPLAIELVAARLAVQSVSELALRLDDHIRLFSIGNRSALPRHRTLAAALDWSIALLSEPELTMFRRLSVFRGRFDVESALGVALDADPEEAFETLIALAAKSLVFFDSQDAFAPYRLLDTTRSYASALLAQSDERAALLHRHATVMVEVMKTATADLQTLSEQAWDDRHAWRLNDVRSALEHCLVQETDAKSANALVIASAPLWFHLSLVAEYQHWVQAALRLVDEQAEPDVETATSLYTVLITALLHTGGSVEELNDACDRALAGALAIGSSALELRARWGRCTHDMFRGEYSAALRHAHTLASTATAWADPAALILSHRVCAMAHHFCGRFDESRRHSEAALAAATPRRTNANLVGPDSVVATKALFCRTAWIQGDAAGALTLATEAVDRAQAMGHSVSMCSALYGACVVALWAGEHELAARWIRLMTDEARRRGLTGWLRYAEWFWQGLRLAEEPDRAAYIESVRAELPGYDAPRREMLVTFCAEWFDDALVERLALGEGLWCAPEIWRAAGWRDERAGRLEDAERHYRRAVDVAREQGTRGWERRAAGSLAALWASQGKAAQAQELLDAAGRGPSNESPPSR
ncbi:winged helix-turn-helix domain-containing protein [Roseateles sp. UC29_93]|uniref:ATP-binding protein n=1 Tax=Roseateles sp. UC29_93 TaxID=3350177 RepID=UPI00366D92B9